MHLGTAIDDRASSAKVAPPVENGLSTCSAVPYRCRSRAARSSAVTSGTNSIRTSRSSEPNGRMKTVDSCHAMTDGALIEGFGKCSPSASSSRPRPSFPLTSQSCGTLFPRILPTSKSAASRASHPLGPRSPAHSLGGDGVQPHWGSLSLAT